MQLKIGNFSISGQDLSSRLHSQLRLLSYYIYCFLQKFKKHRETFLMCFWGHSWQEMLKQSIIGLKIKGMQNTKKQMENKNGPEKETSGSGR